MEKEKGNSHFKQGQYSLAEESYTKAMELDPLNAVLPANRAMVCLKLQSDAEMDCSLALALDDTYVKAYFRRATARVKLGKLKQAKLDYKAMLRYEPGNKQAKLDLTKLEEKLKEQAIKEGFVFPVKRPPHLRSKKPLRRVHIEDIGAVEDTPPDKGRQSDDRDGVKEAQPSPPTITMVTESKSTEIKSSSLEAKASLGEEAKLSKPSVQSSQSTNIDEVTVASGSMEDTIVQDISTSKQTSRPAKSESSSPIPGPPHSDGTKMSVLQPTRAESTCDSVVTTSSHTVEPECEVAIPSVPDSSLQFQADWKRLRRDKTNLAKYFKSIPPSKYPVVLQQSLETDVFPQIIAILHKDYVECGVSCLKELTALTKVKRFNVAVMFLSRKEKESLSSLFRGLLDIVDSTDKATVTSLSEDYNISI